MRIMLEEGKMQIHLRVCAISGIYCGCSKTTDFSQAIKEAPQPKNQQQLRAFLGLVNYYGKFLPTLSTTTHPLNQLLLLNSKWTWSKDC